MLLFFLEILNLMSTFCDFFVLFYIEEKIFIKNVIFFDFYFAFIYRDKNLKIDVPLFGM